MFKKFDIFLNFTRSVCNVTILKMSKEDILINLLKNDFECDKEQISNILKIIYKSKEENKIFNIFLKYKEYVETCLISKARRPNFPSEVSENLVKFYAKKYEKKHYSWKEKSGDLFDKQLNQYIEVKCFSSSGPSSFGPTEKWDIIYFVDAIHFKNDIFSIFKINLNNENFHKKIMVNIKETSYDQCLAGRRPRISFSKIKSQIPEYINTVYNGTIQDLLDINDS